MLTRIAHRWILQTSQQYRRSHRSSRLYEGSRWLSSISLSFVILWCSTSHNRPNINRWWCTLPLPDKSRKPPMAHRFAKTSRYAWCVCVSDNLQTHTRHIYVKWEQAYLAGESTDLSFVEELINKHEPIIKVFCCFQNTQYIFTTCHLASMTRFYDYYVFFH
jgi:hypothetical protein